MIDVFLDQLNELFPEQNYTVMKGRKYSRIVRDGASPYCFIENKTGDCYYAASWKAPAPGDARGNISTPEGLVDALDKCGEYKAFNIR